MAMYDTSGGYGIRTLRSGNGLPEGEMDALLLGKTRELVAATPSQRNWKGILIALLVICAVLGLILFSIYLIHPPNEGPRVKGRKVTIDDVTSSHFKVQPFNGTWISEKELLFRDYLGGLSLLNVETLISRPFIANTTFRQLNADKFFVSSDLKFILYVHEETPFWQHSYLAKYSIYDSKNNFQSALSPFELTRDQEQPKIQWAGWVPMTNSLVFVYENDIYYKPNASGVRTVRITKTGQPGIVYNGIPDWLYEADIFQSNSAIWMSPKGQYLVYATFNDSSVGEASYHWYGDNLPYPKLRTLRYPKAGTTLPTVTISAVNLWSNTLASIPLEPPDGVDINDHYVTGVKWITNERLNVVWMNRWQNVSVISNCKGSGWKCKEIYTVKNRGTGWLDFIDHPVFSKDNTSCLLRIPWRDGEAGYFHHVVLLNIVTRKEIPITHGPFEVTQIVAWDQSNQLIYFLGAPNGKVGQRHLYRSSEKPSNSTVIVAPLCLTCSKNSSISNKPKKYPKGTSMIPDELEEVLDGTVLLNADNISVTDSMLINVTLPPPNASEPAKTKTMLLRLSPCLFSKVTFSPSNQYFVRECLGPGVPTVTLHSAPLGRLLFVLDNNTALKEEVDDLGLPVVRTFPVEVSGGYRAPVKLYLPPGLREEEDFKFPLILHVNGAPGSQLVSEKWDLSWNAFLVSQKNYIVVEIDGRGTGFQGESNRHSIYRSLGTLEATDQLEALRDLVSRLHYIDKDNMAVWGWGYGGYVTSLILAHDTSKIFRCGISVAPITKWEFHNAAYTERYMGLPNYTDNYRGYEVADVSNVVNQLHEKDFLIIHGTADDNVHYQHSLHLTKALIKGGVSFTEQIYPDEGHTFAGVLEHLYLTMETFIERHFDTMDWEDYEKANFLGIQM